MENYRCKGEFLKNQYFGDTRDLFKYDLILELLSRNDFLERFTFIPMLTENTENLHGKRTNYDHTRAGKQRKELIDLLRTCLTENRRNTVELEGFFRYGRLPRKVDFEIYQKNEFFSHETRARYFSEISKQLMSNSVILIDPDIGCVRTPPRCLSARRGKRRGPHRLERNQNPSKDPQQYNEFFSIIGLPSLLQRFSFYGDDPPIPTFFPPAEKSSA